MKEFGTNTLNLELKMFDKREGEGLGFDWQKPTAEMLGRWQPWHPGHTALFKKALDTVGQVCIMIRDVGGIVGEDAGGGRTVAQTDNPFHYPDVKRRIREALFQEGYEYGDKYIILQVPNIVDISYGRGVGYTFTEHDLGEEIHDISATKIRAKMREDGELPSGSITHLPDWKHSDWPEG